ncbi:hypothetical protein BMS3Abin16_01504 [archaeon BMS3Abin16]|nr:hypothetical protein BMS3Abin16_01504 [archaeon BMS3Abin16]
MTIECDVLVVGAGPAGSVVSLICAKNGLNTILLEKNTAVGSHTKTKLDASADGELSKIIEELNLKVENRVYTSRWHPPSGNYFQLESSSPEYFFKRGPDSDSFEVDTVAKAEEAGCRVYCNSKIEDVLEKDGKIDSLTVKINGDVKRIKPCVVIAADGGNSMFHRFVTKKSEGRKKIGYGLTGENYTNPNSSNVYFDAELLPGGYFYLITGESGVSTACIVIDSEHMKQKAKDAFQAFMLKHPSVSDLIGKDSTPFFGEGQIFDLDSLVSENLVFIGEAAGLLDPFFGYGMTSAIVSSYYAGQTIKRALEEDLGLLQNYDSMVREKFDKRLSYLYERVFESLTNDDLDLIAEIITELDKKTDIDAILRQLSGKSVN